MPAEVVHFDTRDVMLAENLTEHVLELPRYRTIAEPCILAVPCKLSARTFSLYYCALRDVARGNAEPFNTDGVLGVVVSNSALENFLCRRVLDDFRGCIVAWSLLELLVLRGDSVTAARRDFNIRDVTFPFAWRHDER